MQRRALLMVTTAQQCCHSSCSGASSFHLPSDAIMSITSYDRRGSGRRLGVAEPNCEQHIHSSGWLPAPPAACGPRPAPEATSVRFRMGHMDRPRAFSSSSSRDRPTLKTQIRELYKRVHPDRFQDHPEAQVRGECVRQCVQHCTMACIRLPVKTSDLNAHPQAANTKSFKMLQEYLAAAGKVTRHNMLRAPEKLAVLLASFHIRIGSAL